MPGYAGLCLGSAWPIPQIKGLVLCNLSGEDVSPTKQVMYGKVVQNKKEHSTSKNNTAYSTHIQGNPETMRRVEEL
jgi:hypothetical protein